MRTHLTYLFKRISLSEVHASIFHNLSTSCPNLKELRLYDITTFADTTSERKKECSRFARYDITKFISKSNYYICICNKPWGHVCYQLQNGKYKELTFKKSKETQDTVSPKRIYYVYYRHVHKFVLRHHSPIEGYNSQNK